ncbi:MAG: hypothetical protein RIQ99_1451, partial [Pseudomonadota bacterium]
GAASDSTSASFASAIGLAGTVSYVLGVAAQGVDSTLTSGNQHIYLYKLGTGAVVGSTAATQGAVTADNTVFGLAVNAAGSVTLTQYQTLDHAAGAVTPYATQLDVLNNGLVNLTASNGTQSQVIDLGGNVRFADAGPTLAPIQNQQVNNAVGSTATGSLAFAAGADGAGAATIAAGSLNGALYQGHTILTSASGAGLFGYVDNDGTAGLSAGDTRIFTLTLNPSGGTKGTYDFTLLQAIDGTITPYVVGTATSFGSGPTAAQVLASSTGVNLAAVAGFVNSGSFNVASWSTTLSGLTAINAGMTVDSVNGSTQGWGVSNNALSQGEMLRFDFGAANDFDGSGAYVAPSAALSGAVGATLTFQNFTATDVLYVKMVYTDGTASFVQLTGSQIAPGGGTAGSYTLTATAGHQIDWIDVYGNATSSGGGKIGLSTVNSYASVTDKLLNFTATLTDSDGDAVSGAFAVNVKTGGSPAATATPIALDLDGGGIQYLDHTQGVTYDYTGSGTAVATAWVASGDGLLAQLHADGSVQIVFSTAAGQTDLEGLAQTNDTNHDGVFSIADQGFLSFGVWRDLNSDGVFETGEFLSLKDAGIVSLNLLSDGVPLVAADGDVRIYGSTTYTLADGSTGIVQDVGFVTMAANTAVATTVGTDATAAALGSSTPESGVQGFAGHSTDLMVEQDIDLSVFGAAMPPPFDPIDIAWGAHAAPDHGGWSDGGWSDGAFAIARSDAPMALPESGGWTIAIDHGDGSFNPVVPTEQQQELHQILFGEPSTVKLDFVSPTGAHEEHLLQGVDKISWG